jgi:two-component system OmpR family sensor kinase
MDGFQARLRDSIQLRLSLWLSMAILSVAILAGGLSFVSAFDEAIELQDGNLRQVAALVVHQPTFARHGNTGVAEVDPESRLIVQSLASRNATGPADRGALPVPPTLSDGLHTLPLRETTYRVLIQTLPAGGRVVVAQETTVRDEIARDSAMRTVLPLLIMAPLLLLLVTHLVRTMLRPVTRLATAIDARSEQDLTPLQHDDLPREIRPFAAAINRLLARVAQSIEAQRRFVADASHELRSPMAALSLQAEMMGNVTMPDDARQRLSKLRLGIERGRKLLDQLLSLARSQSAQVVPASAVSVQRVFRRVLEDLMPLAEAKEIDLGVAPGVDAEITADETDLVALVKNLVDNSIRYTPPGGRIDLSVAESPSLVIVEVEDSGIGIPQHERERVLDPFYRVAGSEQSGSGLGLSIVKAIAERLHGRVELSNATQFAHGLKVRIVFNK